MNKFVATVRVNGNHVKIVVYADSVLHAQILLQYYFGMDGVVVEPKKVSDDEVLNDCKTLEETKGLIKPQQPLSIQQARLNALKTQKDNANKALKIERNRQRIARAQKAISQANSNS